MSYACPEPFHVIWDSSKSREGLGNQNKRANQAVTIRWWRDAEEGIEARLSFTYSELKKNFYACVAKWREECEHSNIPELTGKQDLAMQKALLEFMKDVENEPKLYAGCA